MASFPAFSAPRLFSFIEFNIAFVLGLSLPVILLSILIRKSVPNQWYYFSGIMCGVLGFLYSLIYFEQIQIPALLSFAILTLALIYIWQISSATREDEVQKSGVTDYFAMSVKVLSGVVIIYLFSVWFIPQLDAYIGWLVASSLVLLCGASFIVIQSRMKHTEVFRHVGQWLVAGFFVCTVFFWLNAQVDVLWLILSLVSLFIATMVNGNWYLIKRIFDQINQSQIEESKQLNAQEMFSFMHDPATNLPSYQQALIRLENLFKQENTARYAVVVIKPINFEHVNEVLGHQNSDILLLQLAYCLQKQVANNDNLINFDYSNQTSRLARLQSLHFLAVIDVTHSHYPEKILVEDLCRQLAEAVPEAMSFKSFSLNFELACGIAFVGEHGKSVSEVIAHAGDAVIVAERERSLFQYYNAQDSLYTEQQLLKMERLKQDIENDSLLWLAQPIIENSSKKITGFSLKVKWRHLGDDYIELREFLELAENSGELYQLSKQMIQNAFKLLCEMKKNNIYQPVSISLSSTDILEPDLVDYIEEQIKHFNIAGKYLMIELTEPVMVVACDRAKSMIDQLKMLEVAISIDDFTGSYESLRYIRKLSVNQVKISCEQLQPNAENSAEKAIVNSLINLARTMKLPFVASHIDNKEVLKMYDVMGGSMLQGHVISGGIPTGEISTWIKQWYSKNPQAETKK
ncbi:EAL domain-containing protein [Thalassotalea atypica]|uniref:EAL domain-containing protein n=1 Tax=Thalassotalea atypica TaxID=2054316 RepID=UPI0025741DDB|nr:EAL domain-containing protein [Thalassotalea atypica]